MAGTIIVDTINSSVASTPPVFQANGTEVGTLCRAWVNFNGTGTIAIRASGNVSSITDGGVGYYTINFTTTMPDANYCVSTAVNQVSPSFPISQVYIPTFTTSGITVNNAQPGTADYDATIINVAVFR